MITLLLPEDHRLNELGHIRIDDYLICFHDAGVDPEQTWHILESHDFPPYRQMQIVEHHDKHNAGLVNRQYKIFKHYPSINRVLFRGQEVVRNTSKPFPFWEVKK